MPHSLIVPQYNFISFNYRSLSPSTSFFFKIVMALVNLFQFLQKIRWDFTGTVESVDQFGHIAILNIMPSDSQMWMTFIHLGF